MPVVIKERRRFLKYCVKGARKREIPAVVLVLVLMVPVAVGVPDSIREEGHSNRSAKQSSGSVAPDGMAAVDVLGGRVVAWHGMITICMGCLIAPGRMDDCSFV